AKPNPTTPALDDLIFNGAASDTSKYGRPRWGQLHDYAGRSATTSAVAPTRPTETTQGVHPVLTYARIGYNVSCAAEGEPYKINIMPVVALWNPYNVPIAAHTYEVCFAYVSRHNDLSDNAKALRLGLYFQDLPPGPDNQGVAHFYPETLRMGAGSHYGTGDGTHREFFRFKLEATTVLNPGESRLYTISEPHDGSQYVSGGSTLSDAVVAPDNAVYIPGTALTQAQIDHPKI